MKRPTTVDAPSVPTGETDIGLAVTEQSCDTDNMSCVQGLTEPDRVIDGVAPLFDFEAFSAEGVLVQRARTRYNRRTRISTVNVTVTNTTLLDVPGEYRVVMETPIALLNPDGQTADGEDFVNLLIGEDTTLMPGQALTVGLQHAGRPRAVSVRLDRKAPSLME